MPETRTPNTEADPGAVGGETVDPARAQLPPTECIEEELVGLPGRAANALRKAYDRFLKLRGTPREISLGFALGVFIGMTPFMGVQMAASVFLAALFKWNKFAAALGAWITNPLTAPFIYGVTYMVGSTVVGQRDVFHLPTQFDLEALVALLKMGPRVLWVLFAGGVIVGLPLAVTAYMVAYGAVVEYRKTIGRKIAMGTDAFKKRLKTRAQAARPKTRKRRKKCRRL